VTDAVQIGKLLDIRECGYDELWLQDQIIKNPSCLGFADLKVVSREKQQSTGGRLDILLEDPRKDSMYEVEVMLGQTDETHIVRTIEYWDNLKRKWPQREHYAVLVAESITRRFFNVIQLFAHAIPIIGIQAIMVEAGGQRILTFIRVIDTYEAPEVGPPGVDGVYDEDYWRRDASWTADAANYLFELVGPLYREPGLRYGKHYISIKEGRNSHWWIWDRRGGKSCVEVWVSDNHVGNAKELLDRSGLVYTIRKNKDLLIVTDKEGIEKNADVFRELTELAKQSWEEE
jgi:hypothetical protein